MNCLNSQIASDGKHSFVSWCIFFITKQSVMDSRKITKIVTNV